MKPQGISEEDVKLWSFPFSLPDTVKDWLYYLPSSFITNWHEMKRLFLEIFFQAFRTSSIRKSIYSIQQLTEETLHEYWERIKKLYSSCPQYQISEFSQWLCHLHNVVNRRYLTLYLLLSPFFANMFLITSLWLIFHCCQIF